MRNYGYLGSIFQWLKTKQSDKGSPSLGILLLGFSTSFLGFLLFLYMLQKVYEVPVYTTKFNIVSPGYLPDTSGIRICMLRNYDRPIKPTFPSDTVLKKYIFPNDAFNGGIFISFSCQADSYDVKSVSYRLTKNHEYIARYDSAGMIYPRELLDSIFPDSIFERFSSERFVKPVYTSIETSDRQLFHLYLSNPSLENLTRVNDSTLCEYFYDGLKFGYRNLHMHNYEHRWKADRKREHGSISELWTIVSDKDSIIPVFHIFKPLSFSKPRILTTAEDISRIVEIIELDDMNPNTDGNISRISSITIGYQTHTIFPDNITPKPDEVALSYIRYTDRDKIKEIKKNGLRLYAIFPMMESIQDARIFILSAIITGLGGLLCNYFFKIVLLIWANSINFRRRHVLLLISLSIMLCILLSYFLYLFLFQYTSVNPF